MLQRPATTKGTRRRLAQTRRRATATDAAAGAKERALSAARSGTATDEVLEALICSLEATQDEGTEPASDPRLDGNWRVVYSTAPSPSNGALGPFQGTAFQDVRLKDGVYYNNRERTP